MGNSHSRTLEEANNDIDQTRKIILGVFGLGLFGATLIVLLAYHYGTKLKERPGNLLVIYLIGNFITSIHWMAHPFYAIPEDDSESCQIVGIITVANEQLLRCYEASIFYALWKIYKVRGTNSHQEIKQRQADFKRINWRFHLFSIAGAIYITLMSLLIEAPGRDYYGLCTLQWVDETEKGPIMFELTIYIMFFVYNVFLCCDVWYSQRFSIPARGQINNGAAAQNEEHNLSQSQESNAIERLQEQNQVEQSQAESELPQEQKEVEYFQKILKWYLFTTTGVGTMLAALNFYAADETGGEYRSDLIIIIHDIVVITQPLLIMILKLDEPLVKREIKAVWNKIKRGIIWIWSGVKKFIICICSCCRDQIKPRSSSIRIQDSFGLPQAINNQQPDYVTFYDYAQK